MTPPPYPRVAHLVAGRGTRDDVVLGPADRRELLGGPVVLEEKLDGANVALWIEEGVVQVALRSGVGAADRAGQLGPLRAWVAERSDDLRSLLVDGIALYGEWMLLTHSVAYDELPAYLVALDLWTPSAGFMSVDERNRCCELVGLPVPPECWRGTPLTVEGVEAHFAQSEFGSEQAEGLVIRAIDGRLPRLAKLLNPQFSRVDDAAWRSGRPRNRLSGHDGSWH